MSEHVCHNLRMSREPITIAALKQAIEDLGIPDSAIVKTPIKKDWKKVRNLSFCRDANELSIW